MTETQTSALRVLILEDVPTDAELVQHELRAAGLAFTAVRVASRDDFVRALREFGPDIILADYSLPGFDGLAALVLAREQCPDVPFLFVTGTMGEERAVEALKQGAADYILKDRMSRLGSAVQRALEDARIRREQQREETKLHEQLDELRRFEKIALERELRMQELKQENQGLLARLAELEQKPSEKAS